MLPDIKLFNSYVAPNTDTSEITSKGQVHYTKIFMYGENEEPLITPAYKQKLYTVFKCRSINYKNLFNCVASYDTAELGIDL